ncbi:hypothetical protein [Methylobacterium brachiatum]|uniref:hypothetical protein n=1 Tax=Methylobacterium brachiatum TaxID=269660 RepID=UPI00244A5D1D|nr:hypothetical protein [Methylobacterium brachiatum]MDH2308365.1 hypothetical protein [Methylobacterium brachiatum]
MALDRVTARIRTARHRLALLLCAIAVGPRLPEAAQAQIRVRQADCFLEADGKTYIDGPCEFLTDPRSYGNGGFRLASYENGYLRYGAVVTVTAPGSGMATWTERPGSKPDDGPSDIVRSPGGACWTGSRVRACAWKIGEGRPGFTAAAAPPDPGTARTADCLLEVGGEARIDGPCQFRPDTGRDGGRGFEVRSYIGGKLDMIAQLIRDPKAPLEATGFWNGRSGALRAADPLGGLSPNGPCWENGDVRLCVWQPGQPRGAWNRRAGDRPAEARSAPSPAPPPPAPRDTAEAKDPPPGTFLKLSFMGRCESLVMDGEDLTAICVPAAQNTSVIGSAKAGFIFGTTDGKAMAFMASTKGFVEGGTLHQPIDELVYAERDQSTIKVKGTCEMPNPMGGPMVITCNAQSANSSYAVRFRTDGSKPTLEQSAPK